MKIKLNSHLVILLLIGLLFTNCDKKDGTEPPAPPESPVGEYQVMVVLKSEEVGPNSYVNEFIYTGCDTNSTIKFYSNKTFEFIDENSLEDEDCSGMQIITGDWESTTSISGGFYGDLSFNDTFRGYTMTNGNYGSAGINNFDADANIVFQIQDNQGTNFSYAFYFQKI